MKLSNSNWHSDRRLVSIPKVPKLTYSRDPY